jgi:hypothetical protein
MKRSELPVAHFASAARAVKIMIEAMNADQSNSGLLVTVRDRCRPKRALELEWCIIEVLGGDWRSPVKSDVEAVIRSESEWRGHRHATSCDSFAVDADFYVQWRRWFCLCQS